MRHCRDLKLLAITGVCLIFQWNLVSIANEEGQDLADPSSTAAASEGEALGHGYSRQEDHIIFAGERIDEAGKHDIDEFAEAVGHSLTLCHDVDAASFRAMSEEYTVDANHVYYKWISPGRFWVVVLPDADPETFEVLDFNLARDADRVWRYDRPIPGADPESAVVVRPHWAWKDRNHVYYQGSGFPDADPDTFRHLDQAFYRDAQQVYWSDSLLAQADPETFQTYGDVPYARDKNHVWFGAQRLADVDTASFEFLRNHVFKDEHGVYVGGQAIPVLDADTESFEEVAVLEEGCYLFRDNSRFFVFEPAYIEVYTLEVGDDSLTISKPIWYQQWSFVDPAVAATVSATLTADGLSNLVLTTEPGFENLDPPEYEKAKLQRLEAAFREALAILEE